MNNTTFTTRGVVIMASDAESWNWADEAAAARLNTIGLHGSFARISGFLASPEGKAFSASCTDKGIDIEYELHAMDELLPRALFDRRPELFRQDAEGRRVPENMCVHSSDALDIVERNAADYANIFRPPTHRYLWWIADGQPMCRCRQCRAYSDSDQALIFENRVLKGIRRTDPDATLCHLAYFNTLLPPRQVTADPGLFLEYAPFERRWDMPIGERSARASEQKPSHGEMLDALAANLEIFDSSTARVLEYWLDVSLFSGWKREQLRAIPWDASVVRKDLTAYAQFGIRQVTTFAAWADATYVQRYGKPPVAEYGDLLWEIGASRNPQNLAENRP